MANISEDVIIVTSRWAVISERERISVVVCKHYLLRNGNLCTWRRYSLKNTDLILYVCLSLTKDMTGKEDVYRGPAIRALCRITDVSLNCLKTHLALCNRLYFLSVRNKLQWNWCKWSFQLCFFHLVHQTTMLQAIERYMKQAIVDKVPSVSSSALVSSLVRSQTSAQCYFSIIYALV